MFADELISLHESPREIPPFSDRFVDITPNDGYAAAQALHAHRLAAGWHPVGRKIGFTNRTIWARYGVYQPMWAPMWASTVHHAADSNARLPLHRFVQPRIEPEVVFKLAAPISAGADAHAVLDATEWIAPGFEI